MLKIEGLAKPDKNSAYRRLTDNISLSLDKCGFITVIGRWCRKSSPGNCMAGFYEVDKGRIMRFIVLPIIQNISVPGCAECSRTVTWLHAT